MALHVSKATGQLLLTEEPALETLFPNHKKITHDGVEHAVLPHDLPTYVVLRRMGYTLPNPMMLHYDWAQSPNKPYRVQRATCAMLTANERAYVLNGMGTGKTKSALWSWDYCRSKGHAGKALVVAPLSTLNFVWMRELFSTLPHRKGCVLHGTKAKRLELLKRDDVDMFIINHDGVKVIWSELMSSDLIQKKQLDTLIIDELAAFRNNTDRQKTLKKLAEQMRYVWGMTGAPMPHEVTDVYNQARVVTPWTVPKNYSRAREMLMFRVSEHIWKAKDDAVEMAYGMMQPAVRFSLDDVTELPDLIVPPPVDVPLSKTQEKVYAEISRQFVAKVGSKQVTAVNAAAAMGKLLQIAGGWVYADPMGVLDLDPAPRLQALLDVIASTDHKVIVFSQYRHHVAGIAKALDGASISYEIVHGDVPQKERDKIFHRFQNADEPKVLNAHPMCMAHGVTLTAADTIIWWGPPLSLETYEQANARIRRIGQKHKQQIIHLQGTPVEKKIYNMLRDRSLSQDELLGLFSHATLGAHDGRTRD